MAPPSKSYVGLTLVMLTLRLALGSGGHQSESCAYRKWEKEGSVKLLVVAGLHENTDGRCGRVSKTVVPLIAALDWMVGKLNGYSNGTDQFIPGVTIGYDIYDNCNNADFTTGLLYSCSFAEQQTQCSETAGNQTEYAAIVSLTDIQSTHVVSQISRDTLVLRPLPSSPGIEDEPNVIQNVVSFEQEAKAMVSFLLHQDWNFVVVVHTLDDYGRKTSTHFSDVARQSGICVDLIAEPSKSTVHAIYSRMQSTIDETVALVFFGDQTSAETFVTIPENINRPSGSRIIWIFSTLIVKTPSIDTRDRSFTVQYPQMDFNDFQEYFEDVAANNSASTVQELVAEYDKEYSTVMHTGHISHVVDAVLSVAFTIKQAGCSTVEDCKSKALYDSIVGSVIDVSEQFSDSAIPHSYKELDRTLQYDKEGFQEYNNLDVNDGTKKIGTVSKTSGYIPTHDVTAWSSACKETCENCRNQQTIRHSYLHGDVLILGLFSLRTYGDSPYTCGLYRGTCTDTISVSAFMEYILARRTNEGIQYGGIALDDCYNALNTTHLLAELFSKRKIIRDYQTGVVINFDRVILILGALSSPVSIVVADFATSVGIPMISYAASTPELDNRNRYPYFFRTVPSDTLQVRGMISLLKELGVTHIGAIYIDDSYGKNGIRKLQEEAMLNNICVEDPHAVIQGMSDSELLVIIDKLYIQQVRVVVYFSIESIATSLLRVMPGSDGSRAPLIFIASEAWGKSLPVIQGDLGKRSIGTVVFNIANRIDNNDAFKQYLQNLNINENKHNRWISNFFEDYNKCSLISSFEKIYSVNGKVNLCDAESRTTLTQDAVEKLSNDQRVVHIADALYAAFEGYETFCSGAGLVKCLTAARVETARFVSSIASVKQNNEPLFDDNHNGNIGFTLYNIQLNVTGTSAGYTVDYKQVGHYSTDGLLTITNAPLFYNDLQKVMNIRDVYNTDCAHYESCSAVCLLPTPPTTRKSSSSTIAVTADGKDDQSSTMLAIVIVLAVLLAVLGVALVLVIVVLLRRSPSKDKPQSYAMSNHSNHQFNSFDDTYDVVSGDRKYHAPHSTSGGSRLSQQSHSPIEYSDIRHRSYPDLRINHVRQMSSPEIRQFSTLSTPTTKPKQSPATHRMYRPKSHNVDDSTKHSNSPLVVPKTPYSAPTASTLDKNFRHKGGSSPRFRYPSTQAESSYTYPTGQAVQPIRRVDRGRAETDPETRNPDSHVFDNYLTPKSDDSSENNKINKETAITYLTAKDLVQESSDEEEDASVCAAECDDDTGYLSANPSSVNSETTNHNVLNKYAYDPNLKSPSDYEVSKINFPGSASSPKSLTEIPDVLRHGRYEEEDNVFII